MRQPLTIGVVLASVLCLGLALLAQQSPTPEAAASAAKSVRISFLPPPIEGTLSLGIYDPKGNLVRVLQREADVDDFEIGSDSLSTTWDGRNDAGDSMPPGKYHARGYAVGEIDIEGIGYFFNDWITAEDSPRVARIAALDSHAEGFAAVAALTSGGAITLICDRNGDVKTTRSEGAENRDCGKAADLPGVTNPMDCDTGKDGTLWIIDRTTKDSKQTEVKQFSADSELLRRLGVPQDEPQPRSIVASRNEERIVLLEENDAMQRVRGLTLAATKNDAGQAISDWKVAFEKKIEAHAEFAVENGKPVTSGRSAPDKIKIRLQPNALRDDKAADVELTAGFDAEGAVLKTADGLPLQRISETPGLRRVRIAPNGDKSVDVFQDDGAVVEQFRLSNLDRMMAFDCGDFELK